MLTKQQLEEMAEIAERAEKATEGNWFVVAEDIVQSEQEYDFAYNSDHVCKCESADDAIFIANAREDVPNLLDHIAEQEAEIERLREREQVATKLLKLDTVLLDRLKAEVERLQEIVENEITCAVCLSPIDQSWKYDDGEVICGKCTEVRQNEK